MIKKILKLKNFGIYDDFSWNNLEEFKKFNLIFGFNRSGKTTISRIFEACEKKCTFNELKFRHFPKNGEFEIKINDNKTVTNTNVSTNSILIKVFNQDFIDENVSFDPSNSSNPIVYISKEEVDKKTKLKLAIDRGKLLLDQYNEKKSIKDSAQSTEDNFRISTAMTITQLITSKKIRDRYYAYDKSKVLDQINKIGISELHDNILSTDDENKYKLIIESDPGENQAILNKLTINLFFNNTSLTSFQEIFELISKILEKTIISETILRLKNDSDLNNWVKQGYRLHIQKNEKNKCLFCEQSLKDNFLIKLSKHFSDDYETLLQSINYIKSDLLKLSRNTVPLLNNEIHSSLKKEYEVKVNLLNKEIEEINSWVNETISKLDEKYKDPFLRISDLKKPKDFIITYNKIISEINKIINNHNDIISNYVSKANEAKEKLELHLIGLAIKEQNYKK